MAAARIVLLHSPLVGPGTWRRLAPALGEFGYETTVADLSRAFTGAGAYYPKIAEIIRASLASVPKSCELILVGHSGAGALLPLASAMAGKGLCACVFLDALLPHPGQSWFETIPKQLKAHLSRMAKDGRVPPWHLWWPPGTIEALFGNRADYEQFSGPLRELPFDYFHEILPEPEDWSGKHCAYLQLSEACRSEADQTEAWNWPTRRLSLNHLAMLTQPNEVARELDGLIREVMLL